MNQTNGAMGAKDESRPEPVVDQSSINGDAIDKSAIGNVTEVQGNTHFHETVTAAPLDPLSMTSIQLYFILLVAALNATASGFDGVSERILVALINGSSLSLRHLR